MARIRTSEKGRISRSNGIRSCSKADRASGAQPPMLRLKEVRPMTAADQQRLEMLLDELIERRINHLLQGEGT
jgi:hypothetical protein